MNIIGIDPGKNGGIVLMKDNGVMVVRKMPETMQDIFNLIKLLKQSCKGKEVKCYLERVQGLPGMGGSAMFNFGKNFGWLEMTLMSLDIQTEEVTPQKWQKEYQLGTKGKQTTTVWKNKLKAKAQQLFPKENIFLWGADAILIAEYGRRKG